MGEDFAGYAVPGPAMPLRMTIQPGHAIIPFLSAPENYHPQTRPTYLMYVRRDFDAILSCVIAEHSVEAFRGLLDLGLIGAERLASTVERLQLAGEHEMLALLLARSRSIREGGASGQHGGEDDWVRAILEEAPEPGVAPRR